jgi:acetyl-CoA acetyltransferase
MSGIFIVAAKRTPFGKFGGALKKKSITDLSEIALKAALTQAGLCVTAIAHMILKSFAYDFVICIAERPTRTASNLPIPVYMPCSRGPDRAS